MARPRFSIRVKKGDAVSIYYDISISKKERLRGITNQRVNPKLWDEKEQVAKATKNNKKEASAINKALEEFEDFVEKKLESIKNSNVLSIKDELKTQIELYFGRINHIGDEKELGLFDFIDDRIKQQKQTLSKSTITDYERLKSLLLEFKKDENLHLSYETIGINFYNKFVNYLRDRMSDNTIGKHIKNLKMFLSKSYALNYHDNKIHLNPEFKVLSTPAFNTFLNVQELKQVANVDLNEKEAAARDYFLLMSLTAMRVGDMLRMTGENFQTVRGVKMIVFYEEKNSRKGKRAFRVTEEMESIFKKYNGTFPNDVLEWKISKNYINKVIKGICQEAGITQMVKFNENGKDKSIPKYKMIHNHTGRRNYCTNQRLAGMSPDEIRLQSGHSSNELLERYVKSDNDEIIASLEQMKIN